MSIKNVIGNKIINDCKNNEGKFIIDLKFDITGILNETNSIDVIIKKIEDKIIVLSSFIETREKTKNNRCINDYKDYLIDLNNLKNNLLEKVDDSVEKVDDSLEKVDDSVEKVDDFEFYNNYKNNENVVFTNRAVKTTTNSTNSTTSTKSYIKYFKNMLLNKFAFIKTTIDLSISNNTIGGTQRQRHKKRKTKKRKTKKGYMLKKYVPYKRRI
jgi:hypothetical protein